MDDANTISACHFKIIDGTAVIDKMAYNWHIPKILRVENIKKGDVVLVRARDKLKPVIVVNVFRENIEDTGRSYSSVLRKLETPPELVNVLKQENQKSEG